MPEGTPKAEQPTVCFIGRWEGRKRVELFFELARAYPQVDFLAIGAARDPDLDLVLRERCCTSTVRSQAVGRTWILVNTSARKGSTGCLSRITGAG